MSEQRLLERIAGLEAGGARSHATRAEILISSLVDHLQRILNTRKGTVPMDPEFGVPDFTNIAGSFAAGSTREIIEDLTRMVRRYEPRLKSPRIIMVEGGNEVLSLSFAMEGYVEVNNRDIPIRLATRISSDGRVTLQRA